MPEEEIGVAFRSSVISPSDIVKFAKFLDQSNVANIFVNESSLSFDSLEISSAILAISKGILAGTGVIRLLEHDERILLRRITTLQALSGNRFVLGVGTGRPGPNPSQTIGLTLDMLQRLRKNFSKDGDTRFPLTYIATLRAGIAKRVASRSDGILLNFCTPEHAKRVVDECKKTLSDQIDFACYLKVFYSRTDAIARKLLVEEFENYAQSEQYSKLFAEEGVLPDIRTAKEYLLKNGRVPSSLLRISLANPKSTELKEYVSKFRDAGISLPCVYPYFSQDDGFEFRMETIKSIVSAFG